jgi:UDP-2,3-diacylglucosamine pyrophosphatase LpxH
MNVPNRHVIVISDLHVGAGVLDDCDSELEGHIVEFFHELAAKRYPVELVINGDFLDFAQAPPWQGNDLESASPEGIPLCFTEKQSGDKFKAIEQAHRPIFEALGTLLEAKSENCVTILPGNHDVDLFWNSVRADFTRCIYKNRESNARIRFHLEQVYRPSGFPAVWIEHGHQHDPCNNFKRGDISYWSQENPPMFFDVEKTQRVYECVGTRFMIKYLNQLDQEYPFVDNVKPFSRFIKIFGVSTFTPGYGPLKAAVLMWALLGYLALTVTHRPSDLLGLDRPGQGPHKILASVVNILSDAEKQTFSRQLADRNFIIDRPLAMFVSDKPRAEKLMAFLSENLDLIRDFREKDQSLMSLSGGSGTLTLAKGFSVDETKALKDEARNIAKSGEVRAVIMGHTHETVDYAASFQYLNTGSWTRYYRFGVEDKLSSWSLLRSNAFELFPYQLNYAEVSPDKPGSIRKYTFREKFT